MRNLLGQHFLKTRAPIELMLKSAKEEPAVDLILEVGPGQGALTQELAKTFPAVIAVEKDRQLAEWLKRNLEVEKFSATGGSPPAGRHGAPGGRNCEIITADILKIDWPKLVSGKSYALIANIPYYLTSRLIRVFLEADRQPSYMVLMVQKEVAERIVAEPPQMTLLSLSIQAYGKPKLIARVSKKEFLPQPEVDSAIIKISGISKDFFTKNKISEKEFFILAKTAFSQKRKQIINSLEKFYGSKNLAAAQIKKAALSPTSRPQELALTHWLKLLKT
ncbi:MAG: ribosomal RNA small subunit methyltransferase A [Candidatus Sungbacteria bacterium]|nr:ribosomal RNA small subunit methyltransferase A [Candidatus Sungbacteria bacterium]